MASNNSDYLKRNESLDFGTILSPNNPNKAQLLLATIPSNDRQYKVAKKILNELLNNKMKAQNHLLAQCITPTVKGRNYKSRRFRISDYKEDKSTYDTRIKNCLKTIRKHIKYLGYTVKFNNQFSEIVAK
ncbi:hypothetical protein A2773_01535 [Candidatus Gottesmanbacteria bacterium RIFCSPHIGHO2_01_FULL_39_10]|uniref:Uncharacterized protein n=1 Tax=Candidatus Gottesmanbacteria bacterium RIFCSPHIGHO2_01_FULL_39_10 TaxID=1798375 RepID=A0A1F5ZNY0_9BACT|nr:MAG: hypothetical protein A2773_01535 [Candidatus Gottesmanbacteria bacterium RIFCSPHIGHO2_01_FULL_39_10]